MKRKIKRQRKSPKPRSPENPSKRRGRRFTREEKQWKRAISN